MSRLGEWLLHSEFTVAVAAAALSGYAGFYLTGKMDWALASFVGASAFAVYTLERMLTLKEADANPYFVAKALWLRRHWKQAKFSVLASFALAAGMAFSARLKAGSMLMLGGVLLVAYCYSYVSASRFGFGKLPLKSRCVAKTLILAFSWMVAVLVVPLHQADLLGALASEPLAFYFFSWLFVNAVIFDVRDLAAEGRKAFKAFPFLFGRFLMLFLASFFNLSVILTFLSTAEEPSLFDYSLILPNVFYVPALFRLIARRSARSPVFHAAVDLALAFPLLFGLAFAP